MKLISGYKVTKYYKCLVQSGVYRWVKYKEILCKTKKDALSETNNRKDNPKTVVYKVSIKHELIKKTNFRKIVKKFYYFTYYGKTLKVGVDYYVL